MIQWFSKNENKATATIYPTNITINKSGMEMISSAYAAMLGLDEDDMKIALQPVSKDEYDQGIYPLDNLFLLSGGKTYTRVSSTDFVNKVSRYMNIDFHEKSRKYVCYFDQHESLLIIDLKKEVD